MLKKRHVPWAEYAHKTPCITYHIFGPGESVKIYKFFLVFMSFVPKTPFSSRSFGHFARLFRTVFSIFDTGIFCRHSFPDMIMHIPASRRRVAGQCPGTIRSGRPVVKSHHWALSTGRWLTLGVWNSYFYGFRNVGDGVLDVPFL